MGGEAVSLCVQYINSTEFRTSLYKDMTLPPSQTSYGTVRQAGNFSFIRVYNAGHMVPAYVPAMALELFNRAVFGFDISTGMEITSATTGTGGDGTYGSFPRSGQDPGPFLKLEGDRTITAVPPMVTMETLVIPMEGTGPQKKERQQVLD